MPQRNELGQVAFELMVRKAGHGDGVFAFVAAGEGQAEQRARRCGRRRKQLVEIAHAEQQSASPHAVLAS